ncbi:hypothetical protein [Cerasicoccus arenae]|uniref:Uncharacterized protein n=1 Tax=Cerasicoccus arenae TaxID=424488 RepID=A0A8J3D911_9BACT|nr:hypothetical protein [Cerasicoccus arenae]MBK1856968.1 hypothetical protein [Cerasicoccus arenae]GHB90121.1 hypothetical protein GCM10007047_00920 [Cerasicoccus arenae]
MKKMLMLFAMLCGWTICGLSPTALADDEINPNTVTNEKLSLIRIPEVKFKNTPLSEVIAYLEKESVENDPGPVVTGVRFIYMSPKDKSQEPVVKLSLRNVKLGSALEIICQKTGYEWDFRDGMVIVKPNDDSETQSSNIRM